MSPKTTFALSLLAVSMILSSCYSLKPLQESGRMIQKSYNYYLNDSLKFSYRMGGDYDMFVQPERIQASLQRNHINTNPKHCLAYFETNVSPYGEHYLFYFKNEKLARKALNKITNNNNFILNNIYVDTLNFILIKNIKLDSDDGSVFIVAKSSERAFLNLKSDYLDDIFKNIIVGENYNIFTFDDPFDIARKFELRQDSTVNYLLPVDILIDRADNYEEMPINHTYVQALCTYQSRVCNLAEDLELNIQKWRSRSYLGKRAKHKFSYIAHDDKALDFLVERCAEERIVMFNENHFSPSNRMLISLLLPRLYEKGFRYLAMESIWEAEEKLNKRGFVVTQTGFYTREPMAANMVREAIALGFTVFGYDYFTKDREQNQAENIYKRTFGTDSLAKVVVLAGFGHIHEKKSKRRRSMMAAKFKQLSQIDPLTIDQTEFLPTTKHWFSVIDTAKLEGQKRMQTDMSLANNLTYDIVANQKGFVDYSLSIPDSIYNKINDDESDFIINIYFSKEINLDRNTIPVYNHKIKKPFINDFHVKLAVSDYAFTLKNQNGTLICSGVLELR